MHQISFPAFAQQGQLSTRAGVNSKGSVGPLLADGPPACNLHVLPPQRFNGPLDLCGGHAVAVGLRLEFLSFNDGAYMDAPQWVPSGGHHALCSSLDGGVYADGFLNRSFMS